MSEAKMDPSKNKSLRKPVKRVHPGGEVSKPKKFKTEACGSTKRVAEKVKKTAEVQKIKKKSTKVRTESSEALKYDEGEGSYSSQKQKCGKNGKLRFGESALKSQWKDEEYLAAFEDVDVSVAKNVIELLVEGNTIPFIARYRTHLTDQLKPDKLRKMRETYEYIQKVHEKADKLHKQLLATNALTPTILLCLQTAHTLEDLDFIGSPLKEDGKRTLADRARHLGLGPAAELILNGKQLVNLEEFVNANVPELRDASKVKLGIQHIIADVISKTPEVHSRLEEIYSSKRISLNSNFKQSSAQNESAYKYSNYGDFSRPLHLIKPHQTLAINRGESEKVLSVKIVVPDSLWLPVKSFCLNKWLNSGLSYTLRTNLIVDSADDAIKRLLSPLVVRRLRARLNMEAENEALCVFAYNLRQLLMTPPYSGHVVMGVDPGFTHGCKVAVVSSVGSLLHYGKFYLNDASTSQKILKSMISKFKCEVIALGNGNGCRETEAMLSRFISRGVFKPFNVSYTIISEQAVSIYSCSPVAEEEFPGLHPTFVSAISLARRLQNPLSELVKVEPKHLGVGMYQHDVKEKKLVSTLDEVVSECVSFVGVDVNSASYYLLKRIAGLNSAKAQEIIKYRTEVCTFKHREDLLKVKGIKTATFRQCAGFLRVIPSTARCTRHSTCRNDFNPLDETCIHPESYDTVYKIVDLFGVNLNELGSETFVEGIKKFSFTIEELAKYCQCSEVIVSFLIDTLTKPKDFDLRSLSQGVTFRKEIRKMEELSPGQCLEGVVRNVVNFGAFVDVGVGTNGLIHVSEMNNHVLELNDLVSVEVSSVDIEKKRIQLKLITPIKSL